MAQENIVTAEQEHEGILQIAVAERLTGIGEYYFSKKLREIDELNKAGKKVINFASKHKIITQRLVSLPIILWIVIRKQLQGNLDLTLECLLNFQLIPS